MVDSEGEIKVNFGSGGILGAWIYRGGRRTQRKRREDFFTAESPRGKAENAENTKRRERFALAFVGDGARRVGGVRA